MRFVACFKHLTCLLSLHILCITCCVHYARDSTVSVFSHFWSFAHFRNYPTTLYCSCCNSAGDKNERRRNQRADKAASAAALLQHAISDDRFAAAVQELETSFGAKFSEFITGPHWCLLLHDFPHSAAVHLLHSLKASSCI